MPDRFPDKIQIHFIVQMPNYFNDSKQLSKVKEFEQEIDRLVYDLLGLNSEEIEFVNKYFDK
jgi:hypothetical protein